MADDIIAPDYDLIPIEEAIERLGITKSGIKKRILRGLLQGKKSGNRWTHVFLPCEPVDADWTDLRQEMLPHEGSDGTPPIPMAHFGMELSQRLEQMSQQQEMLIAAIERFAAAQERVADALESQSRTRPWWAFWRRG